MPPDLTTGGGWKLAVGRPCNPNINVKALLGSV
jgi:hypothetical protein